LVVKKGSKSRSRSASEMPLPEIADAQIRVGVPGGGPHGDLAAAGGPVAAAVMALTSRFRMTCWI
jgi:hypothetical protein